MIKRFIPFSEIKDPEDTIAVDCNHQQAWTLSHWRGARLDSELMDDTSTAIVLNAIKSKHSELSRSLVTNNHFDIDGFLGIWALIHPEKALAKESLLRKMACIGDFREWDPSDPESVYACKLCCWMNSLEKSLFYQPFGAEELNGLEQDLCVDKFHFFLSRFGEVIDQLEEHKSVWEKEWLKIQEGLRQIAEKGQRSTIPHVRLQVVRTPEPTHYYALFAFSGSSDLVLSLFDKHRYELEYKYTTWVDTGHRQAYPRLSLLPLARRLNQLEASGYVWKADHYLDTGPILRLRKERISKAERFDHPYQRKFYSSSLSPEVVQEEVEGFFAQYFKDMERKSKWSWSEIKKINQSLWEGMG